MKILFVASECAPFVKTGGLADVIGAVPKALADMGHEVRVLLPAYPAVLDKIASIKKLGKIADLYGGDAEILSAKEQGIDLLLLKADHLYDRSGNIYLDETGRDWSDNAFRYAALSRVGAEIGVDGIAGWKPDLINAHDWQAGLVPVFLRQQNKPTPPVVLTIHNIAFQGLFDASLRDELGLSDDLFTPDGYEFWGQIGYLKGGIKLADKVTTVSPTYARELLLPEFGMGLEGLLQSRQSDLLGILNGIDLDVWDPEDDPALDKAYNAKTLKRKMINKAQLEQRFGLDEQPDSPLFCVISRLTHQKGLDMLLQCLPAMVGRGARLALLCSGDKDLEQVFVKAARDYQGKVGTVIGYDENLSHMLQGGSDAILIPSRFEPCGLTQLYGLRYGTIPVVARTGGLADTVIDANAAAISAKCATGIQFSPINSTGLMQAIFRTCDLYDQPKIWKAMMRRAMAQEVGWASSAESYAQLFESLVANG